MALIRCPDCARDVSSRANSCPQCAYPIASLTKLSDAIEQNDIDLLRDMLRAGFDPNQAVDENFTPLTLAIQKGSLTAVRLLVEQGADKNQVAPSGASPLEVAESQGHEQISEYLVGEGALLPAEPSEKKESFTRKVEEAKPVEEPPVLPPPAPVAAEFEIVPPPVPRDFTGGPPPIPEYENPGKARFIDDTVPYIEDEKYSGPGLICRTCKGQIAAEDIWCAHCKAPIIRRYCGGCRELIPDNAARCPFCNSAKLHRFRYIRHLEQFVAGAAVLGVLLFILSIYGPDDRSYAEKLAEKRAQQQEQVENEAERKSREMRQQRSDAAETARSSERSVRTIPRESKTDQVAQAQGKQQDRIPTVERIEATPQNTQEQRVQIATNSGEEQTEERPEPEPVEERPESARPEPVVPNPAPREPEPEQGTGSVEVARRLNDHGFRLMKRGRYAEAIPVLAQAVRSFPPGQKNLTYAYALYNLGRSLRLVGRPDLAIPILEERMKYADQRHIVARELDMAKAELNGGEPVNNVEFE